MKDKLVKQERALELFTVISQVANLHGYKNVGVWWLVVERARSLFGADGALGIPHARVITGYDATDEYRSYCESAVEELFTADEAWGVRAPVATMQRDDQTCHIANRA